MSRPQAALIIALIAVPIIGYAGAVLIVDSRNATTAESMDALMGHAQSRIQLVNAPDSSLRQKPPGSDQWEISYDSQGNPLHTTGDPGDVPLASVLPSGTRVLRLADTTVEADSRTGVADVAATVGPVWDQTFRGRFSVVSGRAPQNGQEAMVTAAALGRLGVQVGDAVHLRTPISGDFTITGVVDDTRVTRATPEVFLDDGALDGTTAQPAAQSYSYYLPALDVNATQAKALNHAGYIVVSRALVARYGLHGWHNVQSSDGSLWLALSLALVFGAFEVILLAGSAFFIGAKQRQRVLAIIASSGGSRGVLIGVVTLTGALLGAVGGVVGSVIGVGAGSVFLRLTADGSAAHYPGYHFVWWAYALMVLAATVIGTCAAVVPAVLVSRLDVVGALRGATRPARSHARRPIMGTIVTLVGAIVALASGILAAGVASGWFTTPGGHGFIEQHAARIVSLLYFGITGGVIVTQLGLILMSSLVLAGVGAALRRLGVASRLASRDLARNRSRAVPAIASIMTTSFLAVFFMGLIASEDAASSARYSWDISDQQVAAYVSTDAPEGETLAAHRAELTAALTRTLPITKPVLISGAQLPTRDIDAADHSLYPVPIAPKANRCPKTMQGYLEDSASDKDWRCSDLVADYGLSSDAAPLLVVGGVTALTQILGHAPSAAAAAELKSGGAVSLHRSYVADGRLNIGWFTAQQTQDLRKVDTLASPQKSAALPAVYEPTPHPLSFGVVVSPDAARRLGIDATPRVLLASLKRPPTEGEQDALRAAMNVINAGAHNAFGAGVQTGPTPTSPVFSWGALAASSLIALAAAVVALSLARQDGARDAAVFDAVGASPHMRRSVAFWQALIIVGTGAILGALTATLTVFSAFGLAPGQVFAMPWAQVVFGTFGLTIAIALGAWLVAGHRQTESAGRAAIA
ncbi:FtsX-like permease family protein [Gryllotalpicola daejeonensis]|uniref:FtsX-like permease family protein n=1 Tax=Gryllotalpicola daejeonensis TaxID=993087 RepID=UPI0031CE9791